jgi:uncharacterized membrane protein HdeD (DUF308 family)
VNNENLPAVAQAAIRYWWLFMVQGLVALAVGGLLVAKPDKTASFVAVLIGLYIVFFGLVELISAFVIEGGTGLRIAVGLLALIAGGVIVANPEKTADLIVIFIGIFLLVWGLVALLALFGDRDDKALRVFQGLIAAAAGAIVIIWPGPSVTVVAVVLGIWLLISGLTDIYGSLRLRRLATA